MPDHSVARFARIFFTKRVSNESSSTLLIRMVILHSSNVRLLLRGLCSLHLLFHLDTLGGPSVPLLLNSKTGNRDDDDASDYYYVPQGGAANFF